MDFLLPPKTEQNWSYQHHNPQTTPQKKTPSFPVFNSGPSGPSGSSSSSSSSNQMTPHKQDSKENNVVLDPTSELVKNLLTPTRKQTLKKILTPNSTQKVAELAPQSSNYYTKRRNKKMEFVMPDGSPFKPLQQPENEMQRIPLLELSVNNNNGNFHYNNNSGFGNNHNNLGDMNNSKMKKGPPSGNSQQTYYNSLQYEGIFHFFLPFLSSLVHNFHNP